MAEHAGLKRSFGRLQDFSVSRHERKALVSIAAFKEIEGNQNLIVKPNVCTQFDSTNQFYWLELLSNNFIRMSDKFRCLFTYTDQQKDKISIIGIGSLLEIHIKASASRIRAQIYGNDELVYDENERGSFSRVPYRRIFQHLSAIHRFLRNNLANCYLKVPILGGWKAITLTKSLQNVVKFTLPAAVIVTKNNDAHIYSNIGDIEPSMHAIDNVLDQNHNVFVARKQVVEVENIPSEGEYKRNFKKVYNFIKNNRLKKIVITRKAVMKLSKTGSITPVFQSVADRYAGEYAFFFQWGNGKSWMGVSPEVLLVKKQNHIITRPLAGTVKVINCAENRSLAIDQLLNDKKLDLEHDCAISLMINDLKKIAVNQSVHVNSKKKILSTSYVHHLKSDICANICDTANTFDVLSTIYPPATIWGIPRFLSEAFLKQIEPFDREFFTGGFGFFELEGNANFALSIRCGFYEDDHLHVFAGSGIVKDSLETSEWDETCLKMEPFLKCLSH